MDTHDATDFWDWTAPFRNVVVVTGAGLSAAAGLPTYRQPGQTSWTLGDLQGKMHASRYGSHLPELWAHWWGILNAARQAEPTTAHLALAQWQQRLRGDGGDLTLVTQNVDGLHQRAGAETVEYHGSLLTTYCMHKRHRFPTPKQPLDARPPVCPENHGPKTRPDVVLFGEKITPSVRKQVEQALARADLLVMVGTSGTVWPVAGWPQEMRQRGAQTVLVNPEPWGEFDRTWAGPADQVIARA